MASKDEQQAMDYGYPSVRAPDRWFDRRGAYLAERGRRNGGQLCHVINQATGVPARHLALEDRKRPWAGVPWATFILGSGCSTLPTGEDPTAPALAAAVRAVLEASDLGRSAVGEVPVGVETQQFVMNLANDRLGTPAIREAPVNEDVATPGVDELSARVAALTMLLSQFYNRARAASLAPTARWKKESAAFDPDPERLSDEVSNIESGLELALPLCRAVRRLLDRDNGTTVAPDVAVALGGLIKKISEALGDEADVRTLRIDHLRVLTETCWHLLCRGSSIYPGVTDMMVLLALQDSPTDPSPDYGRNRPGYENLDTPPEAVRIVLERATQTSWDLPPEKRARSSRHRFYSGVARSLWAQHIGSAMPENRSLPAPAAFVTSYDVELEMAIWRYAVEERIPDAHLNVIIPVHLMRSPQAERVDPAWFMATIRITGQTGIETDAETERPHLLTLLEPEKWNLLSSVRDPAVRAHPTVIHLSGCPLFRLPEDIPDDLRAQIGSRAPDLTAVHAVTVDEYLAIRQADSEIRALIAADESGPALPKGYTTEPKSNPRFWLALGVPIGEPAIRHRLVSHMTLRMLLAQGQTQRKEEDRPLHQHTDSGGVDEEEGGDLGEPPADRPAIEVAESAEADEPAEADESSLEDIGLPIQTHGVLVNSSASRDEADVIYWLGIDVVKADCFEFLDDIEHYAEHLEQSDPRAFPIQGRCPLARQAIR